MKIKEYGYQESTVQRRSMTIAELKLSILESYIRNGVREVILMDISSGDATKFNSIEDIANNKWLGDCKIEVIGLPHGWGYGDDWKHIIVFQIAEEESDRVIK